MFALPPPRLLIKRLASVTGDIVNVENIAIVAVVNLWILCHLQRLVVVKVRRTLTPALSQPSVAFGSRAREQRQVVL